MPPAVEEPLVGSGVAVVGEGCVLRVQGIAAACWVMGVVSWWGAFSSIGGRDALAYKRMPSPQTHRRQLLQWRSARWEFWSLCRHVHGVSFE